MGAQAQAAAGKLLLEGDRHCLATNLGGKLAAAGAGIQKHELHRQLLVYRRGHGCYVCGRNCFQEQVLHHRSGGGFRFLRAPQQAPQDAGGNAG